MTRDPAEYASASYSPDMAGEIDTLGDFIREEASLELRKVKPEALAMILPTIEKLTRRCIGRAMAEGLLHNDNTATFTDKFKEIVVKMLAEIHAAPNPKLFIDCLSYAFGLHLRQGLSQTSIVKEYGVTRANASKICVQICERYGIPPSRGMKTEEARETFSERQKGKTAKPRAEVWTRGAALKAAFHSGRSE